MITNATDKLVESYESITNGNGKAPPIYIFAIDMYSKISLHSFGIGSTGYSRLWRNNIRKKYSRKNSNILAITLDSSLINDTDCNTYSKQFRRIIDV